MVEVFRTNVHTPDQVQMLLDQIHHVFDDYKANFDLEDCDKILRVECFTGPVESAVLVDLLQSFGFKADVLPDEAPWMNGRQTLNLCDGKFQISWG